MTINIHGSKTFPDRVFNLSGNTDLSYTHSQYGRIYSYFSDSNKSWVDTENMIPFHHWTCNLNYLDACSITGGTKKIDDNGSFPIPLMSSKIEDKYYVDATTGKICYKSVDTYFYDGSGDRKFYLYSDNTKNNEDYLLPSKTGLDSGNKLGLLFESYTLTMWVSISGNTNNPGNLENSLIRNTCGGNYKFDFLLNDKLNYFKMYYGSGGTSVTYESPYTNNYMYGNNWMHLVIGLDVKEKTGEFFFFVDGIDQGRKEIVDRKMLISRPSCFFSGMTSQWFVNSGTTGNTMRIKYEDIRFYTRSLSPHEIAFIYNRGQGTFNQSYCNGYPTLKYPKYWFKMQERPFYKYSGNTISDVDMINITGTHCSTPLGIVDIIARQTGHIDRFPENVPYFLDEDSYCYTLDSSGNINHALGIKGAGYFNINTVGIENNYGFTFWINVVNVTKEQDFIIVGNTGSITPTDTGEICVYLDSDGDVIFAYGEGGSTFTEIITGGYTFGSGWAFYGISVKAANTTLGNGVYLTTMYNNEFGVNYSTPWNKLLTLTRSQIPAGLNILYQANIRNTCEVYLQDLRIFDYDITYDEMINIYNEGNGILF